MVGVKLPEIAWGEIILEVKLSMSLLQSLVWRVGDKVYRMKEFDARESGYWPEKKLLSHFALFGKFYYGYKVCWDILVSLWCPS